MKVTTNRTDVITEFHPCYKIEVSDLLIRKPSALCTFVHTVLCLLTVVTVCGNLLVIISIIYFKQLHTPTNFLILSLAVADLLVGVLIFPLTMEFSITSCRYYHRLFCKVRSSLDVLMCTASILNLCCISIDRYYAVCQPLTYQAKISNCVAIIMILVSWGFSVLTGMSFLILGMNQEKCSGNCLTNAVVAYIMGLIFSFYLPVTVMLCVYLKIFLAAQRQIHSIQSTTKSGAAVSKKERKATKTLAIVMGLFLMCWLPFFLSTTVLSFSHVYMPLVLNEFLNWVALLNSMLNPFIYAFFYCWFRTAVRLILSGKIFQGDFTNSKLQ